MSDEVKLKRDVTCPACDKVAILLYDPSDSRIVSKPFYCDNCTSLWIGGDRFTPPAEMVTQFENVVALAEGAGKETAKELIENPTERIQKYFERVFRWAFSEGFLRAYAMFMHTAKEGRLKRIADLWDKGHVDHYKLTFNGLSASEFKELDRLILWMKKKKQS